MEGAAGLVLVLLQLLSSPYSLQEGCCRPSSAQDTQRQGPWENARHLHHLPPEMACGNGWEVVEGWWLRRQGDKRGCVFD